jgi:hypothetical protein
LHGGSEPGAGYNDIREASVTAGDLETLLSLWTRDRRAKGGWWALAGFSFQSALYLLQFFKALQEEDKSPADLAKTELLSDILIPKDGKFTLIQVKRTLDRPQLAAALREAYEIAKLCDAKLLRNLRFKIACVRITTPARPNDFNLSDIAGDPGDSALWRSLLGCFDENAIIVEPDPLYHLYDFLWHVGIRDAVGFVEKCLGLLLKAFHNPSQDDINRLAWNLNDAFHAAINSGHGSTKRTGRILKRKDIEPTQTDADREILFNRRPQLRDLQLARVRKRPEIFSDLVNAFSPWWHSASSADELTAIPVFWIEGRSGEGKSVLLLQLAQQILLGDNAPAMSHLSSPNELPEWIHNQRDIQRAHIDSGWLPAVAIVDDLHFIHDREGWEDQLRAATNLTSPRVAVLACGPTLEREKFQSDFSTFFDIFSFPVPNFEHGEMEAFRDWVKQRKNQEIDLDIPDVSNRMLVVWIFELLRGQSLREFSSNFKRRLIALDLFNIAREILAINALELPAPKKLIDSMSDSQRDTFQALCSASQLHFEKVDNTTDSSWGYRISHPQIDWQIYQEWASPPATLAQNWGRDLAATLIASAKDSKFHQGNALVFRLSNSSKLSELAADGSARTAGTLSQALSELYRKQTSALTIAESIGTMPRWLEVVFRRLADNLDPDPVQEVVRLARQESQIKSLSPFAAGWLWRISELDTYNDIAAELKAAAKAIIFVTPPKRGTGSTLGVIASQSKNREAALRACKEWLEIYPTYEDAYVAIGSMLGAWPQDEEVIASGWRWTEHNLHHYNVYWLLAPLIAARPADHKGASIALRWIEDNPKHPQAYHVLASLVAARPADERVASAALRWVEDNPTHQLAYHVLTPLVAARPLDDNAAGAALRWVEGNPTHQQAYHVLASLVAARPADDKAASASLRWVEDNPTHQLAYHVLAPLAAARPADDKVASIALRWVQDNPNHQRAYELLKALAAARPADDKVASIALRWVQDNPNHQRAYELLKALTAARAADSMVTMAALKWLERNSKHSHADELLRVLVAAHPKDQKVVDIARTWLSDHADHPTAYNLLMTLITRSDGAEEWMHKGHEILLGAKGAAKRSLLVALLSGGKANPKYVELILDAIDIELDKGNRTFLLASLRRSLANNVQNALSFLAGKSTVEHKRLAAQALAHMLTKNSNAAQKLLELNYSIPAEYSGLLLSACIASEVSGEMLNDVLQDWLNNHWRMRGYGKVLEAMKKHPVRWHALKDAGGVSSAVEEDYLRL